LVDDDTRVSGDPNQNTVFAAIGAEWSAAIAADAILR
jgi:hypothetical protein